MDLSKIKRLDSYKEDGGTAIIRTDYNVPKAFYEQLKNLENANPIDPKPSLADRRIESTLKSLQYLISQNSRIILISHLGRPQANKVDSNLSLQPIAKHLAGLLKLKFINLGEEFKLSPYPVKHLYFYTGNLRTLKKEQVENLNPGDVLFLENIRFYEEEKTADQNFSKQLAGLADFYVNEAFSVSHRHSASISGLPQHLPCFAGYNLVNELHMLSRLDKDVHRPYLVVLGGAKLSDKVGMLRQVLGKADEVIIGGAMANIFLQLKGYSIGDSYIEKEGLPVAKEIWRNFRHKLVLPTDVVIGRQENIPQTKKADSVKVGEKILDIGPESILNFSQKIKQARTIVWNGPLGLFEDKRFAHGTLALGRLLALQGKGRAYVVAGGGDTIEAIKKIDLEEYFDFISTGGGAMLAFLGQETMPGIDALCR